MLEKIEQPQFTHHVAGEQEPTVPIPAKKETKSVWSEAGTKQGLELSTQIASLMNQAHALEDQGDFKGAQVIYVQVEERLEKLKALREEEKAKEGKSYEMKELFKDNFFGMEQVEQAFTLADGTKLIDFSPEQKQEAIKLLYEKLNEPDIKTFMEKVKSGEIEPKDWMLVFRTDKLADGSPLTMKTMQEKLAPDMRAKGQGRLLFDNPWYQNESFYTEQTPANMHWQLTTVVPLESTKSKNHAEQESIRVSAAEQVGLDSSKTRRRTPVETIYDSVIFRRTINQDFLKSVYDWSDVRSSDGHLVHVGNCDAEGASVYGYHPDYRYVYLRVSLSR